MGRPVEWGDQSWKACTMEIFEGNIVSIVRIPIYPRRFRRPTRSPGRRPRYRRLTRRRSTGVTAGLTEGLGVPLLQAEAACRVLPDVCIYNDWEYGAGSWKRASFRRFGVASINPAVLIPGLIQIHLRTSGRRRPEGDEPGEIPGRRAI
jgi:hypothetical protein